MPVQTSYPGVYVQEVPSGVRTIAGVSTSVAVFIGQAAWGPVNEPVLCLNYTEFQRTFTSDVTQSDLARSVKLFFLNGGTQCYIMRLADAAVTALITAVDDTGIGAPDTMIIYARYPGEFGNSIRATIQHNAADAQLFNLRLYRVVLNSAGVEVPTDSQTWMGLSMDPLHPRFAIKYVDYQWAILSQDPVLGPPPLTNTNRPEESLIPVVVPPITNPLFGTPLTLATGSDGVSITSADYDDAYPILDREVDIFNLMILPRNNSVAQNLLWGNASLFCQSRRAFLLIDPEVAWTNVQEATDITTGVNSLRTGLVNDHSAVFFPQITILENETNVHIGASGAIAGLMARTDANRGVWKAPAGVEANLLGIRGLQYRFSDGENGVLNPQGVNTLRIFPNGIVNWGARTMDGDDDFASEYKYIPIRRTALFIEESLYRGLKWVVFEPNDEPLWAQIRLNVGAFMHNLFRQGAFQGTKKQDAYFVKCDSETTTQNDINLGIVNIWVGFAPLKPAEFVVLYLQQMTGQIQV